MQSETKTVSANGLRFAYFEAGSGPLVLLLHGFPDTPHTWNFVQPQLARSGYRVVAPYLRGYPPSEAPADGDYSVLKLGSDILALTEALGERAAIVIGHDWGAFAAYAAANLDPQRVRKLVTAAIPHPGALRPSLRTLLKAHHFVTFQFRSRALARLMRNDLAEIDAIYKRWSPDWRVTEEELAPVKHALRQPGGMQGALGYYWSFTRDAFGSRAAEVRRLVSARTTVPTLAFFGEEDGALDQTNLERTRQCFAGEYEMVRIPKVGHFLHREAPQLFLDRTLEFIKR